MSFISEIRVHISSDQRKLLEAAGLDETKFVRGAFASAMQVLSDEVAEAEKKAAKEAKAEEGKSEKKSDEKPDEAEKSSGK